MLKEASTAIVTHKGAAADAGHYIGFVKKSVFHAAAADGGASSSSGAALDDDDEDWYKFDDDKVSVFPKEKLGTLDGGGEHSLLVGFGTAAHAHGFVGEDASAYLLLYKSKSLA